MKHPQNSWLFLSYNITSESIAQGVLQDHQHYGQQQEFGLFHNYLIKSLKVGLENVKDTFGNIS